MAIYVTKTKMPHICNICQLVHMHLSDNHVSIYASYKLTAITGIHTFHIIGICLRKYACHIVYVCPSALLLYSTYRPHITTYIALKSIHTYIHTYIHKCTCISAYIHEYACIDINMEKCKYIYLCRQACMNIYMSVYVCM